MSVEYIYNKETSDLLSEIILTDEDYEKIQCKKETDFFKANTNLAYDLYKFIFKLNYSTSELCEVYQRSQRAVQKWLKYLGWERDKYAAQQLAAKTRDYKKARRTFKITMNERLIENQLTGNEYEVYIRNKLMILLSERLEEEYEIIIGINSIGIIKMEVDVPIIIIGKNKIYKFAVEVQGGYFHEQECSQQRDGKKEKLLNAKQYKLYEVWIKKGYKSKKGKKQVDNDIDNIVEDIINIIS